jgi:hypothetical protein
VRAGIPGIAPGCPLGIGIKIELDDNLLSLLVAALAPAIRLVVEVKESVPSLGV